MSLVMRIVRGSGLLLGILIALVCATLVAYRPDRPVATIAPGSSASPTFVVQIMRPRSALPLGGLVSPAFFGLEEHLGFDSKSAGASVRHVDSGRLVLASNDGELVVVLDDQGRVSPETVVEFTMTFEDRPRRFRCRPAVPAIGTFKATVLPGATGLSGHFDIELTRCEDAATGKPLNWPVDPFVLHGSFDRLPMETSQSR